MRCIRDPAQPTWTREDQCHPDDYNAMEYSETNYRTTYTIDLVIMVNSCLRPFPENRPTLTRLSKEIRSRKLRPLREDQPAKFRILNVPENHLSDITGVSLLPGPDQFAVGKQALEGLRQTCNPPSPKRHKPNTVT